MTRRTSAQRVVVQMAAHLHPMEAATAQRDVRRRMGSERGAVSRRGRRGEHHTASLRGAARALVDGAPAWSGGSLRLSRWTWARRLVVRQRRRRRGARSRGATHLRSAARPAGYRGSAPTRGAPGRPRRPPRRPSRARRGAWGTRQAPDRGHGRPPGAPRPARRQGGARAPEQRPVAPRVRCGGPWA